MPAKLFDATDRHHLKSIGQLLGVGPEAFGDPSRHDDTMEMLRLWLSLPGTAEQTAALAYLRLLVHGIPK